MWPNLCSVTQRCSSVYASFAIFILSALFSRNASERHQQVFKKMPKMSKVVKKLSQSCQKVVKKQSKSGPKIVMICHNFIPIKSGVGGVDGVKKCFQGLWRTALLTAEGIKLWSANIIDKNISPFGFKIQVGAEI
jgi:hypothetical protein